MAVENHKAAYHLCREIATIVFVAAVLCISVGCNNFDRTGTAQGEPIVGEFRAEDENPLLHQEAEQVEKAQQVVQVSVYRIVISPEDDKRLGQLWSALRPAQLLRSDKELLSRNGLQISVGSAADWPKAVNIIGLGASQAEQDPGLKTDASARMDRRIGTWLSEGLMAELPITNAAEERTFFWHQSDGQLLGKSYPESHKLLVVTARARATGHIELQMLPALKTDPPKFTALHWMIKQRTGNQPDRYVSTFEILACTAVVRTNQFLAIGRSDQTGDASFGAAFFRAENQQKPSTTVLLVVPRIMTERSSRGLTDPGGEVPKELK